MVRMILIIRHLAREERTDQRYDFTSHSVKIRGVKIRSCGNDVAGWDQFEFRVLRSID